MRGSAARWGHVVTAMVTPFDASGAVERGEAKKLARWLIENGSDSLVINGTTGESPTTSAPEKIALVKAAVEEIGSAKVIAGVGGNNTAEVVEAARAAKEAGAGAILAVVPYYNKPSQEGLFQHFNAVASATDLPVMLYNVPSRTITNLEPRTVVRLIDACPTIVAIKEATPDISQLAEVIRITPESFDVYSGDDANVLPALSLGGAGIVSVIGHAVGKDLSEICCAWFSGERERAAELFLKTLPVTRAIFSVPSPAPVKLAMRALGHNVGGVRLPLVDCDLAETEAILGVLREYGLPV